MKRMIVGAVALSAISTLIGYVIMTPMMPSSTDRRIVKARVSRDHAIYRRMVCGL